MQNATNSIPEAQQNSVSGPVEIEAQFLSLIGGGGTPKGTWGQLSAPAQETNATQTPKGSW